jgi:hypothetical protein
MRTILAIWSLLLFAVFAQAQIVSSAGPQPTTQIMGLPVLTGPTIAFPPPTGGLLVQGGYATTGGWATAAPLLSTPIASFATVSSNPVGATDATSNLQVGASTSTVESLTIPIPAVQTGVEITQPGTLVLEPLQPAPQPPMTQAAAAATSGADLGAAQFDVVGARGPGDTRSLGDAVRYLRQHPEPPPVRTFTNEDVQKLKNQESAAPQNPH